VNNRRRRLLAWGVTGIGTIGAAFATWPFIASLAPSARAKAMGAPVSVDPSSLAPGQLLIVPWRGRPVWVLRRTQEMLLGLNKVTDALRDPRSHEPQQPPYVTGIARSLRPEFFVAVGTCTHLGCSPVFRPDHPAPDIAANWQGGFYCPCHGSKFDLAGRVYDGVPAPLNLVVPPYRFADEHRIVIGEDPVR